MTADSSRLRRPLRVFVASLAHETNSFSPIPTSIRNFREQLYYVPRTGIGRESALNAPGHGDAIRLAQANGDQVIEGPCFWAQPSAPVSSEVYSELKDEILSALRDGGPVDLVLLVLHGAMMAQGNPDCEADLLNAVRAAVGPSVPIGAILDLHGNVSPAMVQSGAILVGVKEYPHIDYGERAAELYQILVDMAAGDRLSMHYRTIPALNLLGTTEEPMSGFVRRLKTIESQEGIRSVTLMHGFPWSDTEHTGGCVLVVSQNRDAAAMEALCDNLAEGYLSIIGNAAIDRPSVPDAVQRALDWPAGCGPVVIADSSDNPGGGCGCDSTFLLRELIERRCEAAAIGMIWDPQATQIAADAGVGARLPIRIGGKVGPFSGDPIDIDAEVVAVRCDIRQRMFGTGPERPIGLAVRLRISGIEIVINAVRQQVFGPECFTGLGIDLQDKSIVVVKSSQHFRAGFDSLSRGTIYCDAPGSLNMSLENIPYRLLKVVRRDAAFVTDRPIQYMRWPEIHQIG
ncbi:MAG: M81 family metallopeptidase [Sphingopyxis sp.]|uniref:M81 family metallopeptidase n=1 Tax=Sphingopyxis sp. TaxID=1908224 RepID=UPI002ABA2C91|nr:M81 family metallopeptidase [Sphingopyxis sp.]MDZ3833108.1 M81 family metallopeptidase [Sphingopyxis sp.]